VGIGCKRELSGDLRYCIPPNLPWPRSIYSSHPTTWPMLANAPLVAGYRRYPPRRFIFSLYPPETLLKLRSGSACTQAHTVSGATPLIEYVYSNPLNHKSRENQAMIIFVTKADRLIGHILLMRNLELSFLYRNLKGTSQQRGILDSISSLVKFLQFSALMNSVSIKSCLRSSAVRTISKIRSPASP
jgi:hypothetical protein